MSHTTITAVWQGATGLPGYTKLRFDGELDALAAAACAARMRAMFAAMQAWIPAAVNISWDGLAQVYGSNGQLTGEVPYSPPANVAGVGLGGFSAASGVCVNWLTGLFVNGKRIRGRTFLVPLVECFEGNGTLSSGAVSGISQAAADLAGGTPGLVVASRSGGGFITAPVAGVSVPDRAAVLRSRRD